MVSTVVDSGSTSRRCIASGAASMDDVTITQRGQGVRLEFDGLTLMLAGLHKGDIHAADFDFA